MRTYRPREQLELFAPAQAELFDSGPNVTTSEQYPAPPDFVARIRDELQKTLARVCDAAALPWPDLTTASLAELRFNSIAGWLPMDEANSFRTSFESELKRLYAITEEVEQQ